MKEQYTVAQNAFVISADDGLPAWEALRSRFGQFAGSTALKPVLEVDIRARRLPECGAERIYEPSPSAVSFISARASRQQDSSLILEFMHAAERKPRVWMRMCPELDRAEIALDRDGDSRDHYFLTHALMIAFVLATARTGTLLIHASSVLCGGNAYLFQGKSGTGKSTHAALWTRNIDGAELLNDDHPAIRFSADGVAMAYGTPWSGKTHCYRSVSAPIGAFVRIVRASENQLHTLAPLGAYASLTASVFFMPFIGEDLIEARHRLIERLAASVACCEMHCLPDDEAAITCRRSLSDIYGNLQTTRT